MEIKDIEQLIEKFSNSNIEKFKYEEDGVKLHFSKAKKIATVSTVSAVETVKSFENESMPLEKVENETTPSGNVVVAPLVGIFYSAPKEGEKNYVSVGDTVKKGQTLGIVEAMKLMNEIECKFDGTVKEIYVNNGEAVEYGQPLFLIG